MARIISYNGFDLTGGLSGSITSATATTIVDSTQTWPDDRYNGFRVVISGGTGAGQERAVIDTSAGTTLTVATWDVTPDATSTYLITNDFYAGTPYDQGRALWSLTPMIVPRRNDHGEITGAIIEPRPIITEITYRGTLGYEAAWANLMASLNPYASLVGGDSLPVLVIELNDPDENDDPIVLECPAMITLPGGMPQGGEVNFINVSFLSTDSLWRSVTPITDSSGTLADNAYAGLNVDVKGKAPVHATVRLTPVATAGNSQARTFTLTNNGTRTWRSQAVEVTVGDTYSDIGLPVDRWFALVVDGFQVPCEFIRQYDQLFYVWFVVPYLAPGKSLDCMIVRSSESLPEKNFVSYTQPAFNYRWTIVHAASGTTTSADFGSPAWDTDMWDDGVIEWLDGPNAGQTRRITSNDDDQIFWTTPLGSDAASGHSALIRMSANGYWTWRVQQTERANNQRGMYWIDKGQKEPSEARYSVPGAWFPYLYYNNADKISQPEWTMVNVGTEDFFAILNASRTWEGGASLGRGLRADGMSINMPFEIETLKFNDRFLNPNGMCRLVLGTRTAGAGDFIIQWSRSSASDTLEIHPTEHIETLEADTYQLYLGVIPRANDAEIGTKWASDDGTATSGSTTQLNDNTKNWITDQWIGGTVRIVSGTGAGQSRTISDSSGNTLTPSSNFTTAPDETSRYRLKQKPLIAQGQTHDILSMTWDTTNLVISALSAWTDCYIVDRTLYVDRATSSADPPYQRIRFTEPYTGRHLVIFAGETLTIDGEQMRAWIEDGSGTVLRVVPPRAFIVQDVEADGTERLAERWLWLTPGLHDIDIDVSAEGNDYTMDVTYSPAWFA